MSLSRVDVPVECQRSPRQLSLRRSRSVKAFPLCDRLRTGRLTATSRHGIADSPVTASAGSALTASPISISRTYRVRDQIVGQGTPPQVSTDRVDRFKGVGEPRSVVAAHNGTASRSAQALTRGLRLSSGESSTCTPRISDSSRSKPDNRAYYGSFIRCSSDGQGGRLQPRQSSHLHTRAP